MTDSSCGAPLSNLFWGGVRKFRYSLKVRTQECEAHWRREYSIVIVRLGNVVRFTDCPTTVSATTRKQQNTSFCGVVAERRCVCCADSVLDLLAPRTTRVLPGTKSCGACRSGNTEQPICISMDRNVRGETESSFIWQLMLQQNTCVWSQQWHTRPRWSTRYAAVVVFCEDYIRALLWTSYDFTSSSFCCIVRCERVRYILSIVYACERYFVLVTLTSTFLLCVPWQNVAFTKFELSLLF